MVIAVFPPWLLRFTKSFQALHSGVHATAAWHDSNWNTDDKWQQVAYETWYKSTHRFKQQKVAFWIPGKFSSLVANGERQRKDMNAWCTWAMKIYENKYQNNNMFKLMQRNTMKMDIKQNRTAAMLSLWPHFFHAFLRFTSVLSYQNPSSRNQK